MENTVENTNTSVSDKLSSQTNQATFRRYQSAMETNQLRSGDSSLSNSLEGSYSGPSYSTGSMDYGAFGATNDIYGGQRNYGSYDSYGSYGSYGRSRMGMMGYGGYSSYGQRREPRAMDPNQPMQRPPISFRDEIWGFLNGAHSIINVFYAGSGILAFGQTFLKSTLSILRFLSHKSLGLLLRLTGIHYLKKLMLLTQRQSQNADWAAELSDEKAMGNAWEEKPSRFGFKKIMTIIRMIALAGFILSWIFRKREQRKAEKYMLMKKAEEQKLMQANEQIQFQIIENQAQGEEQAEQEPPVIASEEETKLLDQAFEESKEQMVTIAEEVEEEEKADASEPTESLVVCELEETQKDATIQSEETLKTSIHVSESTVSRIVENQSEIHETSVTVEAVSNSQQKEEALTATIESESIIPNGQETLAQSPDNQANCQSEEYWKSNAQTQSFFNQVEMATTTTPQVSLGIENENPFCPSMLRQASTKPKESGKALPWLKRTKTTTQ